MSNILNFLEDCLKENLKEQEKALKKNNFTKYANLKIGEEGIREQIKREDKEVFKK